MKWMRWYIIIMVLLVGLYLVAEYNRPRTIDWTPTFSNKHKIPYGTYILYNELAGYFDGKKVKELRNTFYDHMNNSIATNEVYMLVCEGLQSPEAEVNELLNYVSRGNTVFIAADYIDDSLLDTLHTSVFRYKEFFTDEIETDSAAVVADTINKDSVVKETNPFKPDKDSVVINLANPLLKADKPFGLQSGLLDAHFSKLDTGRTTILGINNLGEANFVKIKIGNGHILLHCLPRAFTNYFILKDKNIDYVNKVMSYLPQQASAVYWNEYYKQGATGAQTPLRVILSKPNLRWAYYLALFTVILYVVFNIKRRQRIIPVITPPKNDSKEFVETVSRVYFNQKHHLNIANKKISYWLDAVRTRFAVPVRELNDDFVNALAHRSGADKELIKNILGWKVICHARPAISADELITISKLIDTFYKQAK